MIKGRTVFRNLVIIVFLGLLLINRSGLYLTPLGAHESSERSIHYGPSEVVHVENFKGGKYILAKYDKWISCNTVKKELFFFWRFGSQVTGVENDTSKGITHNWGMSDNRSKVYGIINDKRIKRVEITLTNNESFEETKFYDDMFLFTWDYDKREEYYLKEIKGYDSNNKVVFQDETLY